MCVLALAWRTHPRWRLVLAGNRDELHTRPSAPLTRWDRPDHVLAGKDLQSGGTWLGVSEQGRLAVVTNLRGFGAPQPDRPSRGALVADVLTGDGAYAGLQPADLSALNPFNLVLADRAEARFLTNRPDVADSLLAPGVYGLSNGALDAPWPKTLALKSALLGWMMRDEPPRSLLDPLRADVLPDVGLRSAPPSDAPQEPALSAVFIRNPVYGTRCSTIVAIDEDGRGEIIERRYDSRGEAEGETTLPFAWR